MKEITKYFIGIASFCLLFSFLYLVIHEKKYECTGGINNKKDEKIFVYFSYDPPWVSIYDKRIGDVEIERPHVTHYYPVVKKINQELRIFEYDFQKKELTKYIGRYSERSKTVSLKFILPPVKKSLKAR